MNLEDIRIGVSPLTNRIYLGAVSQKDASVLVKKVDATSRYIASLLAWVEPGTIRTVVGNDGTEYEIEVRQTKRVAA